MYIYTHAILYRAERERERKKIKRRAEHRWVPVAGPLKPQKTVRPSLTLVDGKGGGKVSFLSLSLSLSSSLSLHLSLSLPYVRRCFGGPPSIPPSFLLPTAAVQKTRIRHIEGERGRWIPGKCATVHSRRPQRWCHDGSIRPCLRLSANSGWCFRLPAHTKGTTPSKSFRNYSQRVVREREIAHLFFFFSFSDLPPPAGDGLRHFVLPLSLSSSVHLALSLSPAVCL